MTIVMTGNVSTFFGEALDSAFATQRVEASAGARAYLVGVLVDFTAGPPKEALDRPVTLLLDEALHAPHYERFERLKQVGDGSLYVTGLFQEHLAARGVDIGYVSSVGATAYGSAASMLRVGGDGLDLFGELARKFESLVRALHEVADTFFAGSASRPDGVLKVYERWQKTGSPRLRHELAMRGLVPQKAAGGLQ